jgi:hypothetical protein
MWLFVCFPAIVRKSGMDSCACRRLAPAGVCGYMCRVLTLFSTAHAVLPVLHGLTDQLTCTAALQVLAAGSLAVVHGDTVSQHTLHIS